MVIGTAGFHLDGEDEIQEVAGWGESLGKEMKMIRHYAVGMNCEGPCGRRGSQDFHEFGGVGMVSEDWMPAVAANSYEIELAA